MQGLRSQSLPQSPIYKPTENDIEQQHQAVTIGIRTIDKYLLQLGPGAATYTKNFLIHGVPGSGKSYVTKQTFPNLTKLG